MADPTSGDPSENEANVDLKGVIKDLHDEIKALNALLQSFGAGIQANTKNFHKSTADQVMLIKLQGEMVRQNADYRKSLTTSQDAMKMFTGALTKGIPATAIFGAALTKIGGLTKELDNFIKVKMLKSLTLLGVLSIALVAADATDHKMTKLYACPAMKS